MPAMGRRGRSAGPRPPGTSTDGAILAFLSEVLIGDSAWTMPEVRRLIAMRELAELGRWRAGSLDDGAGTG